MQLRRKTKKEMLMRNLPRTFALGLALSVLGIVATPAAEGKKQIVLIHGKSSHG